jgi:hypothetical protein
MSTAGLQTKEQQRPPRAASAQGHRQYLRSRSNPHQSTRSASHPHPSRQYEKDLILCHTEAAQKNEVLPEEQINKDPVNKKLGQSSQTLRVTDFDLMRTLGTGKVVPRSTLNLLAYISQAPLLECGYADSTTRDPKTVTRSSPSKS